MADDEGITDLQLARLADLRARRPAFRGGWWRLGLAGAATAGAVGGVGLLTGSVVTGLAACGVAAALAYGWRTVHAVVRLKGRWDKSARMVYPVEGAPRLKYRAQRTLKDLSEWVLFEIGLPENIKCWVPAPVGPWLLLEPRVEIHDRQRALLGPTLRWSIPRWVMDSEFVIIDGRGQFKLGQATDADDERIRVVTAELEAWRRRLDSPVESLRALALDLDHPFDAARACAALVVDWPAEAARIVAEVAEDPVHLALVRLATTGQGLTDTALSWPMRAAIAGGVLGVNGPARDRLLDTLEGLDPTDVPSAMALADLNGAAEALLRTAIHARQRAACLRILGRVDDPAVHAWLQARVELEPDLVPLIRSRAQVSVPMVSRVTRAHLVRLSELRAIRPTNSTAYTVGVVLGAAVCGVVVAQLTRSSVGGPVAIGVTIVARASRRRAWQRRLGAKFVRGGLIDCPLDEDGGLGLAYRFDPTMPKTDRLILERDFPRSLTIAPGGKPLLDAAFDQALGVNGTEAVRALIGPVIRTEAPRWHARCGFQLKERSARIRLGEDGIEQHDPDVQSIVSAMVDFSERLAEPAAGLAALAVDTAHVFDATRAFAALVKFAPRTADEVGTTLADAPIGAIIHGVVREGTGLGAPSLTWETRSAIGRGMLAVELPSRAQLIAWIEAVEAEDGLSAMAIAELAEAARVVAPSKALDARRQACLDLIAERGGPECLGWLQLRAKVEPRLRRTLRQLSLRLQSAQSGYLSLEHAGAEGGLSDARVGEVALAEGGDA